MIEAGCATPHSGWQALQREPGPLFLKTNSWGEFVFDFAFANAYAEHGMSYYPKLVCAVPFTPVEGPRWAGTGDELQDITREYRASGAHVLFLPESELPAFEGPDWLRREDLRFVWKNRDYSDFDDFLAALSSKKRKNLRAERRKVATQGWQIAWAHAGEIDPAEWPRLYALYASTYAMRGQQAYLNEDCLRRWALSLPEQFLFCLARLDDELQAMAFFFRDEQRLYGRHWGARADFDALHFELCYYQGIEYCIRHGLDVFDAGVQGGHRLLRGFEPVLTRSVHWFADRRFQQAIGAYLHREREQIQRQWQSLCGQTAYRQAS